MKLNPLSNRVVIKFVEAEEKTSGPGKVTDNGARAPVTVKGGDKVIASKYAGTSVKLEGTEYTILSEDDILAVVD